MSKSSRKRPVNPDNPSGLRLLLRLSATGTAIVGFIRLRPRRSHSLCRQLWLVFNWHRGSLDLALDVSSRGGVAVGIGTRVRGGGCFIAIFFSFSLGFGFGRLFIQGRGLLVPRVCLFVVSTLGDLEVNLGTETRTQRAIDVAGNGRRQVTMRVGAARDHYHRQARIDHRSIRRKQSQPGSLANARTGLSGNRLFRTISFSARTIVDGANHSRQHAFPGLAFDIYPAPHFSLEL